MMSTTLSQPSHLLVLSLRRWKKNEPIEINLSWVLQSFLSIHSAWVYVWHCKFFIIFRSSPMHYYIKYLFLSLQLFLPGFWCLSYFSAIIFLHIWQCLMFLPFSVTGKCPCPFSTLNWFWVWHNKGKFLHLSWGSLHTGQNRQTWFQYNNVCCAHSGTSDPH
jgi:hypothetical protein